MGLLLKSPRELLRRSQLSRLSLLGSTFDATPNQIKAARVVKERIISTHFHIFGSSKAARVGGLFHFDTAR
jgi:hypothetical protein